MNRRQRRAARKRIHGEHQIRPVEVVSPLDLRCPDCASKLHHWTDPIGIHHVDIYHDDTCPTWKGLQE